jgi:uncharacterized protein YprB with RNaseH-like and TPR domain/predicted nuclease with RNAse H fold
MLEQTFVHIPGIGPHTERNLWNRGIRSWDDVEQGALPEALRGGLKKKLEEFIPRSRDAFNRKDASFFERLSAIGEAWRIFPAFADSCVYLDIETTGLSTVFDTVTMVGLYDGRKYEVFIEGQNLQELPSHLRKYSVVITFNGSGFDLRFLRLAFPALQLPPVHIDLRWVTRRLGLTGGLKAVEERLKIKRAASVQDMDGYDATVLWARYIRGERSALEQLIQYNTEDVVHLKAIMEISYDRLAKKLGAFSRDSLIPMFSAVSALPRRTKAKEQSATQQSTVRLVEDLLTRCREKEAPPRIVGIDLTGSERRATGWALLEGPRVTTRCLSTDEELVRETIQSGADIVSIDSPLSLPNGHSNPDQIGDSPIYRKCELALKRMGISVFWCLLPSMRMLTIRGIKITRELRKAGMHVIESYPGAAQDLLGIPRKGSSLEELKWGLNRAGIVGEFISKNVTHDEVDAITSALVGLFFLADEYIALGNAREDYLIVPRSPRINYARLAEILRSTGLDPTDCGISTSHLECLKHGAGGSTIH